jgi:hypothetical protein
VFVPAAVVVTALLVLAFGGYFFNWTWTGFGGNTVWDWLSLLITPVTLGLASIALTMQTSQRKRRSRRAAAAGGGA